MASKRDLSCVHATHSSQGYKRGEAISLSALSAMAADDVPFSCLEISCLLRDICSVGLSFTLCLVAGRITLVRSILFDGSVLLFHTFGVSGANLEVGWTWRRWGFPEARPQLDREPMGCDFLTIAGVGLRRLHNAALSDASSRSVSEVCDPQGCFG